MSIDKITLYQGDITKVQCHVIVNAANTSLLGGGGVDGAIHRAGGINIDNECKIIRAKQGRCKVGEAVITTAGNLPAKKVIHTVGPIWNDGNCNERELLRNCYRNVLKLAHRYKLLKVAIPNISTGVYRFPKEVAAQIAVNEVLENLPKYQEFQEIIFVCYNQENYNIYKGILD